MLDVAARKPRSTCRDLVPIPPGTCPSCGAQLHTGSSAQPSLFLHGGYGEVRRKMERSCSCGVNVIGSGDYTSENPRSL